MSLLKWLIVRPSFSLNKKKLQFQISATSDVEFSQHCCLSVRLLKNQLQTFDLWNETEIKSTYREGNMEF